MRTLPTIALLSIAAMVLAGCAGTTTSTTTASPSTGGSTGTQPAAAPNPYAVPSKSTQVSGSGATFPKPLIESWGLTYAQLEHTVQVSYTGKGSGAGITDITTKAVVFGATDAPMQTSEKAKANGASDNILQFPETLGLQDLVYNIKDKADSSKTVPNGLKLDADTVAKIFLGTIKSWDDPAIDALQTDPAIKGHLPSAPIATVSRSDSSGTTFAFTDYLQHAAPAWQNGPFPGASKKPAWTTTLSGSGNDGVGTTVRTTPNSIGYVELAYIQSLNLNAAMMKNHDGVFLSPTTDGASSAAASYVSGLPTPSGDWSKVSIVDAPGKDSWPISTFTYIMVYDDVGAYGGKVSNDQMMAFKAWMWWCLHDGQAQSQALGYAPLPAAVIPIGEAALAAI